MGIRAKIVLPFTLLFAVAILAAALLAAQATGRAVEERIQAMYGGNGNGHEHVEAAEDTLEPVA